MQTLGGVRVWHPELWEMTPWLPRGLPPAFPALLLAQTVTCITLNASRPSQPPLEVGQWLTPGSKHRPSRCGPKDPCSRLCAQGRAALSADTAGFAILPPRLARNQKCQNSLCLVNSALQAEVCTGVKRAGWPGMPNAVFLWLHFPLA